jgi:hypothetical protein
MVRTLLQPLRLEQEELLQPEAEEGITITFIFNNNLVTFLV